MRFDRRTWAAACAAFALSAVSVLAACGGSDDPPVIRLAGAVQTPHDYNYNDLVALPPTTQTDSFTAAGVAQTHIYTGTSLQGLLDAAVINVNAAVKNDFLNDYVVATGADGYRVVFAVGETRTDFGNRPSLVAYAETINGALAPLGSDGFARVTSPGDVKGGRYVSNLTRLDVRASDSVALVAPAGGLSTQFTLSGAVNTVTTFDTGALQALPQVTTVVGANTYTGPTLWSVLNAAGLKTDATLKNPTLAMYVVATGSDGYRALLSGGELDPGFGNQPDMVALTVNGAGIGTNGFARIVVPNDVKAGRWVSNLVKIEVFTAAAAQ